ncbi:MAG: hypothetical protein JSV16_16735 [Candidatus Hydrogenedentota bacterium]|nr:MAG: hypothetical protein JSV16_16735 [Candidatus Hydrogenedentota bacterium]
MHKMQLLLAIVCPTCGSDIGLHSGIPSRAIDELAEKNKQKVRDFGLSTLVNPAITLGMMILPFIGLAMQIK